MSDQPPTDEELHEAILAISDNLGNIAISLDELVEWLKNHSGTPPDGRE